jgi:hypothetical protein
VNFSDLNFYDHSVVKGSTRAEYTFRNYWTISVVAGPKDSGLKGDIQHDTFEVGVMRPNGIMLEDVIIWQTPVQITTMMHLIEML